MQGRDRGGLSEAAVVANDKGRAEYLEQYKKLDAYQGHTTRKVSLTEEDREKLRIDQARRDYSPSTGWNNS